MRFVSENIPRWARSFYKKIMNNKVKIERLEKRIRKLEGRFDDIHYEIYREK